MKEGRNPFLTDDGASSVGSGAVVVAGAEERIVVPALELEACFKHFGRDIDEGGGEVSEETCEYLSELSKPQNKENRRTCCEIRE